MIVTDKKYFLEQCLIDKLDLYIKRACQKRKLDIVIIVDGDEGFGKTGISILSAYYLSQQTGREFNLNNIFFDPREFVKKINSTKKQILIWDEAALGGLASGWRNKIQQILIQTLMTCRFRQHIIFFNCPKFYRLNQYFVTDRAWGLIHVYSRDGIQAGRFTYYQKEKLDNMLEYWQRKRFKPYKKFANAVLRGSFPDIFNQNIIDEDKYDEKKDHYTSKLLGQFSIDRHNERLLRLQYNSFILYKELNKKYGIKREEVTDLLQINKNSLTTWGKIPSKYPQIFGKTEERPSNYG